MEVVMLAPTISLFDLNWGDGVLHDNLFCKIESYIAVFDSGAAYP